MRRLWLLSAVLCSVSTLACRGQVVRVAGAAESNVTAGSGAAVSLYGADSTSTVGAAVQGGVHMGARREVSAGDDTLALGDSTLELPLPSDLENTPRSFLARGLLLRHGAGKNALFVGMTGDSLSNSYVSSVVPSRFVSVASSTIELGPLNLGLLTTRGVRNNMLISVSGERNPFLRFAVTAGRSESRNVLRMLAAKQGSNYRFAVSENLGNLRLQPAVNDQTVTLERIGLNAIASRSFGQHWTLDGARHSYATAGLGGNTLYSGVTASRSDLLEGGSVLHVAGLQAQTRVLRARSGPQHSEGTIASAAWTAQRWSVQAVLMQSRVSNSNPGVATTNLRSVDLQAGQQITPRLRLEQTATFGGNSTGMNFGGSWVGDRFSVSLTNREMFVPFGDRSGFHSVMLFSVRVRLRSNEVTASVSRGAGLPSTVLVSTDGYYGSMADAAVPQAGSVRLPRYVVQGHVHGPEGEPVRGAAVRVASDVVYTDSDGRFLARFNRDSALPVRLEPGRFVTAQTFRAVSGETWVRPSAEGGEVELAVERCSDVAQVEGAAGLALDGAADRPGEREHSGRMLRTLRRLGLLTRRMVSWRLARTSSAV